MSFVFDVMGPQPRLERQGLELGSQFTYRVGLVFPSKGSSTLSDTLTSLNPSKHPYFSLRVTLFLGFHNSLFLSLFPLFLSKVANPHSLLNPFIYSIRLMGVS